MDYIPNDNIPFLLFYRKQPIGKTWKIIPTRWRWNDINVFLCRGFFEALVCLLIPFCFNAFYSVITAVKLLKRSQNSRNGRALHITQGTENLYLIDKQEECFVRFTLIQRVNQNMIVHSPITISEEVCSILLTASNPQRS